MGLLEDLASKAKGAMGATGGEHSGMINAVLGMLGVQGTGGLAGMVQAFKDRGLQDIINSWVGTGENKPITPEQIQLGLGKEKIQELADKAGVTAEAAKAKLAEILPGLVDKLTPQGKIPEGGMLQQGLSFLKSKLS